MWPFKRKKIKTKEYIIEDEDKILKFLELWDKSMSYSLLDRYCFLKYMRKCVEEMDKDVFNTERYYKYELYKGVVVKITATWEE